MSIKESLKFETKLEQFENELRDLINKHSLENTSNTPDFILANYLLGCLKVFNETVNRRLDWYTPVGAENDVPIKPKAPSIRVLNESEVRPKNETII